MSDASSARGATPAIQSAPATHQAQPAPVAPAPWSFVDHGTHACRICNEAWPRADWLALHLVREHADSATGSEREAAETAWQAEEQRFKRLGRHVQAWFVLGPFFVFYFLMLVWLREAGGNVGFGLVPLPGIVGFSALIYWMVYTKDDGPKRGRS